MRTELNNRTISSFPLSIGTGLMLETLFDNTIERYDNDREIPIRIDVNKYKYHIYNIYTLARNIVSATEIKDKTLVYKSKFLLGTILEEMSVITELYSDTSCTPIFYIPKYDTVFKLINADKVSGMNKAYEEYIFLSGTVKVLKKSKDFNIITDTYKLPRSNESVLITTHLPIDLFNQKYINKLTLLESHTGKVKGRYDWNTKYNKFGKRNMLVFPFMEELLYILGDRYMSRPHQLSYRKLLYETALKNNWTVRTSRFKVISDLEKTELKDLVKKYKKIYT